jgi:hypothetical protein
MTGKCWSELKIFIYLREQLCLFFRKINFHMANTYGNTFNLTFLYIQAGPQRMCFTGMCCFPMGTLQRIQRSRCASRMASNHIKCTSFPYDFSKRFRKLFLKMDNQNMENMKVLLIIMMEKKCEVNTFDYFFILLN